MKTLIEKREIDSFSLESKEFTVAMNEKAFRLLFSQIYPDIIKAVVRELITNAWDSQKQANNLETPIEVHVPNAWDPYFSVRDYGVGMTHKQVFSLYSNLFESTKDKDNEYAGMFGIGSKTPLGYSKMFTLQCWDGETSHIYNIYIGNNGTPVIDLIFKGESTESRGVLVKFNVNAKDFDYFAKMTNFFAFGVPSAIKIDGKRFEDHPEILAEQPGWQLVKHHDITVPYIRMGCVLYSLDFNNYNLSKISNKLNANAHKISRLPIIFDVPIGTVEVSASREDLIYNDELKDLLYEKFKEYISYILKDTKEKISKKKTLFDAWALFSRFSKDSYFLTNTTIFWKRHSLSCFSNYTIKIPKTIKLRTEVKRSYNNIRRDFSISDFSKSRIIILCPPDKRQKFLQEKVNLIKKTHTSKHTYNWPTIFIVEGIKESYSFKKLWIRLGFPLVIDVDLIELPESPKTVSEKQLPVSCWLLDQEKSDFVGEFDVRRHYYKKTEFSPNTFSGKKKIYYLMLERGKIGFKYEEPEKLKQKRVLIMLRTLKKEKEIIVVINKSETYKLISQNKQFEFIDLKKEYEDLIDNYKIPEKEILKYTNKEICRSFSSTSARKTYDLYALVNGFYHDCLNFEPDIDYIQLAPGEKDKIDRRKEELLKESEEFVKKYPICTYLDNYDMYSQGGLRKEFIEVFMNSYKKWSS